MKLKAWEIPDEATEAAAWLDRQLIGPDLTDLVLELSAVHGQPLTSPESTDVRDWLGADYEAVMQRGVASLSPERRGELLRRPWRLLALQEEIDLAGGTYWNQLTMHDAWTAAAVARGAERLAAAVGGSRSVSAASSTGSIGSVSSTGTAPASPVKRSGGVDERGRPWSKLLLAAAALAAALMIGFFVVRSGQDAPAAVAWGWNEKDLFGDSPSSQKYLERLADAGAKWSKKRPETKQAVSQRIREMIAGCERLIAHEHPPLAADERAALQALCKKWLGQFQEQLASLERDASTPLEARDAMDGIVEKLTARLRSGRLT